MSLSLWVLQNTLAAGCLAILVAMVCRFGRFSPAVRHAFWLLVLLNLVVPPIVELPLPRWLGSALPEARGETGTPGRKLVLIAAERFYDFTETDGDGETLSRDVSHSSNESAAVPAELISSSGGLGPGVPGPMLASPVAEKGDAIDSAGLSTAAWSHWLLWGWGAGTALFILLQGARLVDLHRMKRRGHVDAGRLTGVVRLSAEEMRVRPPTVWIVPGLPSPALCAWGRAALLWPDAVTEPLSSAGERAVVLHELAHLRRRDHWVGWLELLAGCAWWWNPLFWYVRRQLHENAELACDSWVVALLPEERRAYAEALIDVAQGASPALPGIVLGAGDGSRKLMERRLIMIMRGKVKYRIPLVGLALLTLVAVATIPRWTIGKEAGRTDLGDFEAGKANLYDEVEVIPGAISRSIPGIPADLSVAEVMRGDIGTNRQDVRVAQFPGQSAQSEETLLVDDSLPSAPRLSSQPAGSVEFEKDEEISRIPVSARTDNGNPEPIPDDSFSIAPGKEIQTPGQDRISILESQLLVIQNELNALRHGNSAGHGSANRRHARPSGSPIIPESDQTATAFHSQVMKGEAPDDTNVETIVMTRSTYKLPPGRAVLLEKALRELLSDDVEIKVKNDSLQITAAEEDQQAIHQLIRLMQRKGREPSRSAEGANLQKPSVEQRAPVANDYAVPKGRAEDRLEDGFDNAAPAGTAPIPRR